MAWILNPAKPPVAPITWRYRPAIAVHSLQYCVQHLTVLVLALLLGACLTVRLSVKSLMVLGGKQLLSLQKAASTSDVRMLGMERCWKA